VVFPPGVPPVAVVLAPPQHPPPDCTGLVAAVSAESPTALAGYPAAASAATALAGAERSVVSIAADPTATDFTATPGTAERALVTACTQCPQLMPSIESEVD
jgi:hypothetical protein